MPPEEIAGIPCGGATGNGALTWSTHSAPLLRGDRRRGSNTERVRDFTFAVSDWQRRSLTEVDNAFTSANSARQRRSRRETRSQRYVNSVNPANAERDGFSNGGFMSL